MSSAPPVDPTVAARFAEACGATAPLELVVERDDGIIVAAGSLAQPFALIGREPVSDVHLPDNDINPRHAFLQVVGGRVFAADLGSKTGLEWPTGRRTYGWMNPEEPVRVGPYRLYLANPVAVRPQEFGPSFHPLAAGPDVPPLPKVDVHFRNGRAGRTAWNVNRVITIIGRAKDCKIHLGGEDVSQFHCYLTLTPDGLWVNDLLGRGGIRVNGHSVRCQRLNHSDELTVGRFVLAIHYADAPGDTGTVSFDIPMGPRIELDGPKPGSTHGTHEWAPTDTMAGPNARPVQPTMAAEIPIELLLGLDPDDSLEPPLALVPVIEPVPLPSDPAVQQLAAVQKQMFDQFQQAMGMMVQMFGTMHKEQMATVQAELDRMQEVTKELTALQQQLMAPPEPSASIFENRMPDPETVSQPSPETAQLHAEVWERMSKLNEERQSIWQRVLGKVGK